MENNNKNRINAESTEKKEKTYTFVGIKIEGTGTKIVLGLLFSIFLLLFLILFPLFYKTLVSEGGAGSGWETQKGEASLLSSQSDLRSEESTEENKKHHARGFREYFSILKAWISLHILEAVIVLLLSAILILLLYKRIHVWYLQREIAALETEKMIIHELLQKIDIQYQKKILTQSRYLIRREIYKERELAIEQRLPRLKAQLHHLRYGYRNFREEKEHAIERIIPKTNILGSEKIARKKKNKEIHKQLQSFFEEKN